MLHYICMTFRYITLPSTTPHYILHYMHTYVYLILCMFCCVCDSGSAIGMLSESFGPCTSLFLCIMRIGFVPTSNSLPFLISFECNSKPITHYILCNFIPVISDCCVMFFKTWDVGKGNKVISTHACIYFFSTHPAGIVNRCNTNGSTHLKVVITGNSLYLERERFRNSSTVRKVD